jgi:hypothetical protein
LRNTGAKGNATKTHARMNSDFKTAVSQQGKTKDVAAHVNERRHAITDVVVWAA